MSQRWRQLEKTTSNRENFTWRRETAARRLDYILLDPDLERKVVNTSSKKKKNNKKHWFLRTSNGYMQFINARKKRRGEGCPIIN